MKQVVVCQQPRSASRPARDVRRSGQALIEFAVIAFVMTLLLGAMLTFGFMLFGANVLQQAADVGAMELARHPYSPTGTFDDALSDVGGSAPLFLEEFLVCEIGGSGPEDLPDEYEHADVQALQDRMPLINRLLFPLYIFDPDINYPPGVNQPSGALRYPGTVVQRNSDNQKTVVIPIVGFGNRDADGVETISEWRKVVEEILVDHDQDSNTPRVGSYNVVKPSGFPNQAAQNAFESGMVALRINFPYQSGAMVAYQQQNSVGVVIPGRDAIGLDGVTNVRVVADDDSVQGDTTATFPNGETLTVAGYTLVNPTPNPKYDPAPHRGAFGFGEAGAYSTTVRPYRKVLTAQGIYRREVFE
jgi:hypothetical protein